MTTEILMPQLGQAMLSGTVLEWHVANDAHVEAGQPLLSIESDKAAFEIEAAAGGRVRQIVAAGGEADVGAVLGTIGEGAIEAPATEATDRTASVVVPIEQARAASAGPSRSTGLASPRARAAAQAAGIDLTSIAPSGADGIISVGDVTRAIEVRGAQADQAGARRKIGAAHAHAIQRLQSSWSSAPHIVQMFDVDATGLRAIREKGRLGRVRFSLNDVFIWAAAQAIAQFPDLNAHIEGDEIVGGEDISVSIAVATERGLRTPILTALQDCSIEEIADRAQTTIEAARLGHAKAGRSSLTISNLGAYGIRMGTPVLNLDEAILIFIGAMEDRVVALDGAVVIQPRVTISIAYDHRIADGLRAAEFSALYRKRLEQAGNLAPD
jgi:pyruvate/2-oxoglutarate dehydrogenase complex dihydrolipoamide acyltransferase (E2) component